MKLYLKIILGIVITIPILYLIYWAIVIYLFSSSIPSPHDVPLDIQQATSLKNDFLSYEKIFEMDDATRCYKSLNNESLKLTKFSNSEHIYCNEYGLDLDEILNKYDIKKETYFKFRKRLEQSKLRTYCYEDEMSLFITDGFLDNSWGYLYSDSTLTTNDNYFRMCGRSIRVIEIMEDNWYQIGGN